MPISISASAVETFSRNSVLFETHDSAALTNITSDFSASTVTFTFTYGTPANNSFVKGALTGSTTAPITVTVNTITGAWFSSSGLNGTLSGGQLTTLNNNQRTLRNSAETVANNLNVITGSVVAWT